MSASAPAVATYSAPRATVTRPSFFCALVLGLFGGLGLVVVRRLRRDSLAARRGRLLLALRAVFGLVARIVVGLVEAAERARDRAERGHRDAAERRHVLIERSIAGRELAERERNG